MRLSHCTTYIHGNKTKIYKEKKKRREEKRREEKRRSTGRSLKHMALEP